MPPSIHLPSIHMNGTSAISLTESAATAVEAISRAIEAMHDAAPSGRDYYPQGIPAWEGARADHENRMARLRGVREEMEAIMLGIADGGHRPRQLDL